MGDVGWLLGDRVSDKWQWVFDGAKRLEHRGLDFPPLPSIYIFPHILHFQELVCSFTGGGFEGIHSQLGESILWV